MHRDFKRGLALGMIVIAAGALWLAGRSSIRPTRFSPGNLHSQEQSGGAAVPVSDSPAVRPAQTADRPAPREPNEIDWPAFEQDQKTQKFHIVGKGETLSEVARRYYGSPTKWQKIYDANRDVITDPDKLRPGTKLIIPD